MRLLVVGADAAGMSGAMAVRRLLPSAEIVAFERGPDASYSMCGIPAYLGAEVQRAAQLVARSVGEFAADGVEVRLGAEVTRIDPDGRRVRVRSAGADSWESYDALLYAAGGDSVMPALPGLDRWGVPVRTLDQARRIRAALDAGLRPEAAVVVGGGYIGLEVAEALVRRGVATTLVERGTQVLDRLDADMARVVEGVLRDFGVNLRLGESLVAVEGDGDECHEAVTDAGRYPAGMVVAALGARPAVSLAAAAGCEVGETGALAVDGRMRTSVPEIWAAGDCVQSIHLVTGQAVNVQLGTHANKQGKVAGLDIAAAGGATVTPVAFPGVVGTAVTKVCSWEIATTGVNEREAGALGLDYESVRFEGTARAGYLPDAGVVHVKMLAERGTGRLLGAQLVGTGNVAKRIDVAATWCQLGVTVQEAQLHDLAYAPAFGSVWDLLQVGARKLTRELGLGELP